MGSDYNRHDTQRRERTIRHWPSAAQCADVSCLFALDGIVRGRGMCVARTRHQPMGAAGRSGESPAASLGGLVTDETTAGVWPEREEEQSLCVVCAGEGRARLL